MLLSGEVDVGIATEALSDYPELVALPCYRWTHSIIVPPDHALLRSPLTIESLALYPLITYDNGFTGRTNIDLAFSQRQLSPNIVLTAMDADVIKTYVQLGMGVGIVASIAFDSERDRRLQQIETQLFGENVTLIAVRLNHVLRGFAYKFIELCNSDLDIKIVREAALADLN